MPQENYRYYRLEGTGYLHGAQDLQAENDEQAIALVATKHPHAKWELWQERRLVANSHGYAKSNELEASRRTIAAARLTLKNTAALIDMPARLGRAGDAG